MQTLLASRRKALMILFYLALASLAGAYFHWIGLEWDTRNLLQDVHRIRECLGSGTLPGCRGGGRFPLLQIVPAYGLQEVFGLWEGGTLRVMACLSFLAFLALARLGFIDLKQRSVGAARVWIAALVLSPCLWYARSSFGEMIAAFATLCFVMGVTRGKASLWVFSASLAASLSKDTAIPILLILLILLPGSIRAKGYSLAGIVAGAGLAGALNWFRFGSLFNELQLLPHLMTRSLSDRLLFFAAEWLSPSGGLLWFFPALVPIWFCVKRVHQSMAARILALLVLITLGLSGWYAPFGWIAWGPRLILPWYPAVLWLLIQAAPSQVALISQQLKWSGVVMLLISFQQFSVLFCDEALRTFFRPQRSCAGEGNIELSSSGYYDCAHSMMWKKLPILLTAWNPVPDPIGFASAVLSMGLFVIWFKGKGHSQLRPADIDQP